MYIKEETDKYIKKLWEILCLEIKLRKYCKSSLLYINILNIYIYCEAFFHEFSKRAQVVPVNFQIKLEFKISINISKLLLNLV